jgi:hypothetical protein
MATPSVSALFSAGAYWIAAAALALRAATSSWATAQDASRAVSSSARLVRMIGT